VIVEVPAVMPKATPDDEPIVAIEAVLLLQVPPPVELLSVVVEPTHTLNEPPIAAGLGLTVTGVTV
jgi:hypothetical protein